jgi:hypothetical protein
MDSILQTHIDHRIDSLSEDWRAPTAEVLDTLETVLIALRQYDVIEDPGLIADLTALILDRHDRARELF